MGHTVSCVRERPTAGGVRTDDGLQRISASSRVMERMGSRAPAQSQGQAGR